MYNINLIFEKLYSHFNVSTITELSQKLNMSQPAVTNWQRRNSVSAIQKKCRELGIYNEIFGDLKSIVNNYQNSSNVVAQDFSNNSSAQHTQNIGNNSNIDENILKLIDTLYSFAKTNNKIDELKTDLSSLLRKYI